MHRVGRVTVGSVSLARVTSRYRGSAVERFFAQLNELDFVDLILIFAASLLLSVLPLVILMASFAGHRIDTDITRHIGLNRQGAQIMSQLFRSSPSHPVSATVVGILVAVLGSLSVAGTVQSMFERVFRVSRKKNPVRQLVWLAVVLAVLVAESAIYTQLKGTGAENLVAGTIAFLGTIAVGWWSMHFLLAGRVPWRQLLPSALGVAVLWIFLELFADLYFSSTIVSDSRTYGTIGVVFSLMTWFIAVGAVVVLGTVLGKMLGSARQHRGGMT